MDKAYAHARALTEVNAQHGLVQMITLLTKEHKYKEAFVLLDKALASAPDDYLTLYALGRIASMSGERLDDGLRALQRCLSMDVPKTGANHAGVQYRMGLILKLQGKKANAEQCFDEALQLEGDNKFFAEQVRKARQT